jgi:hypothetical protein
MPVAVVMDFKDVDLDQYDRVSARLGHEPGGTGPSGSLFHWATKTPDGLRVVDVWTDQASFESYAEANIMPAVAAEGVTAEPKIAFIPVHNYMTAG